MPQQGAVYGTVRYGEATYGRPLDLTGTALPIYSASPAQAKAVDYQTIQVTWSLPGSGSNLRLVRNGQNQPADENDGTVVLQQTLTSRPVFIDNSLTADSGGKFLYYTLWNEDTSGRWWRSADMQAILPANWGYAELLASFLPEYMFEADDAMSAVAGVMPAATTWSRLTNQTWNDLQGMTWDTIIPSPKY